MTDLDRPVQPKDCSSVLGHHRAQTGTVLQWADGTIAMCDEVAQTLLGLTIDQLQGISSTTLPWQTIHTNGTDFPGSAHPAMIALETGKPCCNIKMGYYRPDGHLLWLSVDARPLFRSGASHPYAVSVSITPLTSALDGSIAASTPSEQHYQGIFESVRVSIWQADFSQVKCAIENLKAQGVQDFRHYFSTQPDGVKDLMAQVKILEVNAATLDLFEATTPQDFFTSLHQLFLPETLPVFVEALVAIAHGKSYVETETSVQTLTGRKLHVLFTVVFATSSNLEGVAITVVDISDRVDAENERHQVEVALRQSEALKDRLLESSPDCIKLLDLEGRLLYMNSGGLCVMEIDNFAPYYCADWLSFWQGHDRQQAAQALTAAQAGHMSKFYGFCPTAKGQPKYWEVIVSPIFDAAGQVEQVLSISRDVTDRKHMEAELWEKNAILNVIHESIPTPIFVKDRAGRITFANPATLKVLGKSAAEVIGYRDDQIYPGFGDIVVENDRRIMATGQAEAIEESPDGIRTFLSVKVPYRDETGAVIGLIGVSSEISDRVQLEREREQVLRQAQAAQEASDRANRIKDEFLAVLSHELRTPLNPILGWTKILKTGRLDAAKTQEAVSIIERNAHLQTQLIEDLLDISRILQGKFALTREPVDPKFVITAAQETVRLAADAKRITLISDFEANAGRILGDAGRLQQVVWNLLTNAVKFTPHGGHITVGLHRIGTHVQIQVSDTGKGIPPDFLPHVFERFRQADSSTTRKFGGLGLGLAIVRQLVEMHGGTITAESLGEGQGATFTVVLPVLTALADVITPMTAASSSEIDGSPLSGYRILVVDDEMDSRELVAYVLKQSGAIVTQAASALEALDQIEQTPLDALVSDIGMPDMNGYALMHRIRAQGVTLPALALTAYAGETNEQEALLAGFAYHLAKPVNLDHLIAVMVKLVQ